jgi:hypothetical protein
MYLYFKRSIDDASGKFSRFFVISVFQNVTSKSRELILLIREFYSFSPEKSAGAIR